MQRLGLARRRCLRFSWTLVGNEIRVPGAAFLRARWCRSAVRTLVGQAERKVRKRCLNRRLVSLPQAVVRFGAVATDSHFSPGSTLGGFAGRHFGHSMTSLA